MLNYVEYVKYIQSNRQVVDFCNRGREIYIFIVKGN